MQYKRTPEQAEYEASLKMHVDRALEASINLQKAYMDDPNMHLGFRHARIKQAVLITDALADILRDRL